MRRWAGAALGLLLAGCGSGGGEATSAPGPERVETVAKKQTELISVPWRLAGTDGPLLELRIGGAGCVSFQDVDVTETAKAVTIKASAVRDVTPGIVCTADITTEQAPTVLAKPLGARRLVHAQVSPAWPGPKSMGKDVRGPLQPEPDRD